MCVHLHAIKQAELTHCSALITLRGYASLIHMINVSDNNNLRMCTAAHLVSADTVLHDVTLPSCFLTNYHTFHLTYNI
jgi:hypothetical protein